MVPITEEEKNGPLYKYFIRDMVEPDPAKYAQTQDPVDFPEEESPLHLDNLFEPGYMPVELGYGYLPDGCAISIGSVLLCSVDLDDRTATEYRMVGRIHLLSVVRMPGMCIVCADHKRLFNHAMIVVTCRLL